MQPSQVKKRQKSGGESVESCHTELVIIAAFTSPRLPQIPPTCSHVSPILMYFPRPHLNHCAPVISIPQTLYNFALCPPLVRSLFLVCLLTRPL